MPDLLLVRFGAMRLVGRFHADSQSYERGQQVVITSNRGTELGEVLTRDPFSEDKSDEPPDSRIIRLATSEDLDRAGQLQREVPSRIAACERILQDGSWSIDLLDVEALLEPGRTIIHYLGPHRIDLSELKQAMLETCALDVLFAPAGVDPDSAQDLESGGCGAIGCGQGGCGSCKDGSNEEQHGCATESHACSSCAVRGLSRAGSA